MARLIHDPNSWLAQCHELRHYMLIPVRVDQLYCSRTAEVKGYHVRAASSSDHVSGDDLSHPYSLLQAFAMLFRALQPLLPVVEDPSQAEIHDLIDHDLKIRRLAGF
jgi:hypothetical protein